LSSDSEKYLETHLEAAGFNKIKVHAQHW
jgi:hypothetical protein